MSGPDTISRRLRLPALLSLFFPLALGGAEISWTGGGGDSFYESSLNWDGGAVPGSSDTVLIEVRRGLRSQGRIMDYNDGTAFGSMIVDVPNFALRAAAGESGAVLHAHGDVVFRSGHAVSNIRTFGSGANGNDVLVLDADPVRIVNNSAGAVSFSSSNVYKWELRSAVNGALVLSGPGDFIWYGGLMHESVRRFVLDSGFAGTLTVLDEREGGSGLRPAEGIEVRGGTLVFAADEVVDENTGLRIGGSGAVVDFSGRTESLGSLVALEGGGTLRVDGESLLTFSGLRLDDVLNVDGFVEGKTRIAFPEDTGGLENLRINGAPAYWAESVE